MKFYKLEYSSNIKEVGVQFQSEELIVPGDILNDVIPREGRIEKAFKLPEPILHKKAKRTSLLNVIPVPYHFLVLKNDFIDYLEAFEIQDHQKWNITVHQKNEILTDYSLFYCPKTYERIIIDFSKSVFLITDGVLFPKKRKEEMAFQDFEEYFEKRRELISIKSLYLHPQNLVLDFRNCKEDLIRLHNMPMTGTGYYLSERLKNAIEEKGFTGMIFKEINDVDKRIEIIY